MNNQEIARRVREIREQRGLSQQELANLMGWKSHASIVAIENAEQSIKMQELLKLASILNVSPEAFYSETSPIYSKRPVILWRKKAIDPKIALREEHNLIEHYQNYRLVERLVEVPSPSIKTLPRESCDISSATIDWANQLAEKIYREFRLGDYPAALLTKCLEEEYGVLLISCPLEDGSAACYREENGAVVMFNEKEVLWRQIFNLAHELFHLITWDTPLISQIQSDESLFRKNEKLADAFAAALLMPQQMIDLDVRGNRLSYSFIVALAGKYQVSKQAMLLRLCYLRFISSETVTQALADSEFLQLDHDTFKQAFAYTPPFGNRFIRLAYLAYENGRLSKARLAKMLSVKLRDLSQYLAEKGLCLTNDKEIEGLTC
jgi:Zn-dependent peptidase ImmA (M78 family)/DNA-binding XRE family transcriptional regulator